MAQVTLMIQVGGTAIQVSSTAGYEGVLTPTAGGGGTPRRLFVPNAEIPVVFPGVAPGEYLASAELVTAAGGTVLASSPAVPLTVPASVTLQGPIGVTASVTFA